MKAKSILIITAAVAIAAVLFIADPSTSAWAPKCPFKLLTGYNCPACGSQRLLHALFHLRLYEAFRYNALLFLSLPYIVVLIYASLTRTRNQRLYRALNCKAGVITPFVIIGFWWVFRNIIGW